MSRTQTLFCSLLIILAAFCGGCAHYEYEITSPPELKQHIGEKEVVVHVDPLEYRFLAYEDHLIVQIFNPTGDVIQFLGEQSTIVDPSGQSHPLRGQPIPPNTYMKLVLPPVPHYQASPGPQVGFGMGVGYGGAWREGLGFDSAISNEPQYVAVYEPGVSYWEWNGETDVRLLLSFQRGTDKPFTQQWTFHRKKM